MRENTLERIIIATNVEGVLINHKNKTDIIKAIYPLISTDSNDKVHIYSARGIIQEIDSEKKVENPDIKDMKFMQVTGGDFDKRVYLGRKNELVTLDRKFQVTGNYSFNSDIAGLSTIDNEAIVGLKNGTVLFYPGKSVKEVKVDDEIKNIYGKDKEVYMVGKKGIYQFDKTKGFEKLMNIEEGVNITGIAKTDYGVIITTPSTIHRLHNGKFENIFRTFDSTGTSIRFAESVGDKVVFGLDNCSFYECEAKDLTSHIYTHDSHKMSKTLKDFPDKFKQVFSATKAIRGYDSETSQIYHDAKIN